MEKRSSIIGSLALSVILSLWCTPSKASAETDYELSPTLDITLSVLGAATQGIGSYLHSQMEIKDRDALRPAEDFFPWDRKFMGRYSETADLMSDIGSVIAVAPLAIGGYAWYSGASNGKEFATFSLMFVQSILFQSGINLMVRSLEVWPRPYVYSDSKEGLEAARNAKGEAYGSFFSGHASAAFTVAVFASEWYDQVFPNSANTGIVRALAFSLAGFESVLRVAAGKHYPTDILMGALVGTGVSYGVLTLHKKRNKKFSLWVFPGVTGATLYF